MTGQATGPCWSRHSLIGYVIAYHKPLVPIGAHYIRQTVWLPQLEIYARYLCSSTSAYTLVPLFLCNLERFVVLKYFWCSIPLPVLDSSPGWYIWYPWSMCQGECVLWATSIGIWFLWCVCTLCYERIILSSVQSRGLWCLTGTGSVLNRYPSGNLHTIGVLSMCVVGFSKPFFPFWHQTEVRV